jgi:HAE1 family hydrophobic/amphiphilic exporter-1
VPTRFTERERKIDIRVRMDRQEVDSLQTLLQINVNPAGKPTVPLLSVAKVKRMEGPSEIRRIGNLRGAEVQAALVGFDLGTTQARVIEALAGLRLPRGIEVRLGGQKEDLERSQDSLTLALLLAVFLVYIVMASQFESLVQPLVILVSLPFALIGVVGVLDLLDIPLSVVVFLGAIVLAGIVVNNAIILIDQINRQRANGLPKTEAIIRGAHTRLRPVLMTTLTTVLGLLPLTGWLGGIPIVGGATEGIELRAPMAITVITGLVTSTLLTLIVVPVVYSLSDRKA